MEFKKMKNIHKPKKKEKIFSEYDLLNHIIFIGTLSVLLFLYGYFPTGYNETTWARAGDIPKYVERTRIKLNEIYVPMIKKLVIMVIDALRWDFVDGEENKDYMPFTNNLLNNDSGCLYKMKVNPPTVTMPRIKAMTTGTVSNFLDIVFNLGASSVGIDNILWQAKKYGYKSIFYGDDTWLKLFPNEFYRSEGTTSFYVSDYTEVDNNVTRNLNRELDKIDWSIMILHYLGLDHIGHTDGPFSPLIKPKLREMDDIISLIHADVELWEQQGDPTLFIILGDHGMKDSGGHGGASLEETTVPLIVFGRSCTPKYEEIDQIDLAPTLALLLGVPIPYSSLGKINLEMMDEMSYSQKLFALYYNAHLLFRKFQKRPGYLETNAYKNYQNAMKLHEAWLTTQSSSNEMVDDIIEMYEEAIIEIKDDLMGNLLKYDLHSMVTAMIFLCNVLYISISEQSSESISAVKIFIACFVNYAFWILLNGAFGSEAYSIIFLPNRFDVYSLCIAIVGFGTSIYNCYLCAHRFLPISKLKNMSSLECLLAIGTLGHALSLASSSFVEEEHQTWYFYWISLIVYITFRHFKLIAKKHYLKSFMALLLLMITHRILRKLNSTGDKYAHLPDIAGWLKEQDDNFWMSMILISGLVLLIVIDVSFQLKHHKMSAFMFDSAISILVYIRHAINSSVIKPSHNFSSQGITEMYIFWGVTLLYSMYMFLRVVNAAKSSKQFFNVAMFSIIKIWIIVSCILHRPYNVILLPAQVLVSIIIHGVTKNQATLNVKMYFYLWSSNAFYFYQGNSNSLATIDVAAGYVGLKSYNPILIGLFLIINTYSAIVLGFLLYIYDCTLQAPISTSTTILAACRRYAFWRLVPMTFYTFVTSFQRYHLFVWSVFSPKLLYESTHCAVLFAVMFLLQAVFLCNDIITKRKKNIS
ncbi:GPI ethanolamine phosphate transferase 2 [Trichogramma pretiosum]|uniref:GPI ethanolamine phosphate transferase 2 n=1 Tax=Trichogramma pretiosum TaxID=7493 RepID=UPI0006C9BA98|nr:GPI ethanolamine phosphate transferase 2 [Trichogramma pretiosum]